MRKTLVLVGLVALLLAALLLLTRSRAGPRGEGTAAPAAERPPARLVVADEPSVPAPTAPVDRREAVRVTSTGGTWIVRGHALRGGGQVFPGLMLLGQVFRGPEAEGEPLVERHLRADEAGAFVWALEPPAELVTVRLAPVLEGAMLVPASGVFQPGDAPPQSWTVRATPLDAVVHGRVRDTAGRGLAGARVRERERMDEQETTTDAEGRYALRIAAGGERRLRARASGHAQATITIDATQPGELEAPDFVLGPELRLRGRVVDEAGAPVAGAEVEAEHPFFGESTTSDAQGTFELGTLDPATSYLSLAARRAGYVTTYRRVDRSERDQPVELRLERGVRVVGRVLDPVGAPVAGTWIGIGGDHGQGYSDGEGRFTLGPVPAGPRVAWLWRTGFAQQRVDVEIPAGVSEHTLELRLELGHFVGGIVRDEFGAPLPWILCYARDPDEARGRPRIDGFQTYSGPDGRFRLDGLPAMAVQVGAVGLGRARAATLVDELDREDIELVVTSAASLAGTVVDASTWAPIPSFLVKVSASSEIEGFPAAWSQGVAFTDPEGHWRLTGSFAPDQTATLTIEAPGRAPARISTRSAIAPDPAALVVRLWTSTLVRGQVVTGASGSPIQGARVQALAGPGGTPGEPVGLATTDSAGRFELAEVPSGTLRLLVEHRDWTKALDGPFEVGGAPLERRIELGRGATVRGRLLDADGAPLAGETVSALCIAGVERARTHAATTDAEGRYALTGLAAGRHQVRWERRLGSVRAYDLVQTLDLADDLAVEQDLRPAGRAVLTGTVEHADELPAALAVTVRAHPPAGVQSVTWRAGLVEDGRFRLTGLSAGRHTATVRLQTPDGLEYEGNAEVELPELGTTDVRIRLARRP
ncbi:MAG TPA: carboxypeptidase regulatory-like domain-containing protein [Planctomycetota bacterium]